MAVRSELHDCAVCPSTSAADARAASEDPRHLCVSKLWIPVWLCQHLLLAPPTTLQVEAYTEESGCAHLQDLLLVCQVATQSAEVHHILLPPLACLRSHQQRR